MTPKLPSNPMTITPPTPARYLTFEGVIHKYKGRVLDAFLFAEVRADLADIRSMDDYERKTCEFREGAKRALRRILDQER